MKVSVIIPTYNRAEFIVKSIESVLSQTRPVDEIIVVDDGSTDNTKQVINSKFGKHVKYVWQENAGPAAARNTGIRYSTGDWLALIDSDDVWTPHKNERECNFISENSGTEFLFSHMGVFFNDNIDSAKKEIKNERVCKYFETNNKDAKESFSYLIEENIVPTSSTFFKKECLNRTGTFNENLKSGEDLDLWLRLSLYCKVGFLNEVLIFRRRHNDNLVNDFVLRQETLLQVLEGFKNSTYKLDPVQNKKIRKKIGPVCYELGSYLFLKRKFKEAQRYFIQSLKSGHADIKIIIKMLLTSLMSHFQYHKVK